MTNFIHNPKIFNPAKLYILNRFTEDLGDNFESGVNLS